MRVGANNREIIEISDGLIDYLVSPPAAGPGVCLRCRTWSDSLDPNDVLNSCENCREVANVLGVDTLRISVASLYRKPSGLRDLLTHYKGRDDETDPFDPDAFVKVRTLLGRLLIEHGDKFEVHGPLDGIVVVPSTARVGIHPLERLIETLDLDVASLPILERGDGDLGFRRPHPAGYQALELPPARVLLLDDVYTTGSRLNSAAVALTRAGHEVAGALVIARRVNPDYSDEAANLWADATRDRYDWRISPCI